MRQKVEVRDREAAVAFESRKMLDRNQGVGEEDWKRSHHCQKFEEEGGSKNEQ